MRKMWVNKFSWDKPPLDFQYLSFYFICEHPDTEQEILMFTPAELEAHERRVWEAATNPIESGEVPPDWDGDFAKLISVVRQQGFSDWKKEQGK